MDKYITRVPTWKTVDYSKVSSSGYGRVGIAGVRKTITSTNAQSGKDSSNKKPLNTLQEQPLEINSRGALGEKNAFSYLKEGKRLSIRDERLLQIFASQPDQPLLDPMASDSGCTSSCNSFPSSGENGNKQRLHVDENTPPSEIGKNNLKDFVDISTDGEQLANMQVAKVLVIRDVEGQSSAKPELALLATDLPLPSTPRDNPLIMRIQRDFNSPSASARLRAIKAIKSPTKSAYNQFDVPYDEQSIITFEERHATPRPPPSIQELMENIIVYVEVRTGEDNRSAGVKKVISALGAQVNDKLLRDTTHVVFKDGLLSTYKKAKAWNIPVVSILWIEACKNHRKICDPFEFPISNIDRYENPELYVKMKRHKSMQPDSEANKRVRVKPGTPRESANAVTPKTGAFKTHSTFESSNDKKTDISRFFTQLSSHKQSSTVRSDTETTTSNYVEFPAESPATQFLNKINADFLSIACPKSNVNASQIITFENEDSEDLFCLPSVHHVKKTLNFVAEAILDSPNPGANVRGTQTRRTTTTIQMAATIEATTNSIEEMSLSQTPSKKNITKGNEKMALLQTPNKNRTCNEEVPCSETPKRNRQKHKEIVKINTPSRSRTRRRNSMHTSVVINTNVAQDLDAKKNIPIDFSTNAEESPKNCANKPNIRSPPKNKKNPRNRRTICSAKSIQITKVTKDTNKSKLNNQDENSPKQTQTDKKTKETNQDCQKKSKETESVSVQIDQERIDNFNNNQNKNRRRTLFTPRKFEESYFHKSNTEDRSTTIYGGEMQANSCMTGCKELPTYTPAASSTMITQKSGDNGDQMRTPPQLIGSLLEEHANATIFSSNRNPGRRRTIFDVSMDIITQRLQNINQSSAARRSMARPSNYDLEVRRNSLEQDATLIQSPVFNSMPNLPIANTCKQLFENYSANAKSGEKEMADNTQKRNEDRDSNAVGNYETTPIIKKKRKLFVPNEMSPSIRPLTTPNASKKSVTTPRSNVKRRRTLMPLTQPQIETQRSSNAITPSKSTNSIKDDVNIQQEKSTTVAAVKNGRQPRRSTLDFEAATKLTICPSTGAKKILIVDNIKETALPPNVVEARKNNTTKAPNAAAVKTAVNKSKLCPNTPAVYLVYTNMHKDQIEVIKKTVTKLGYFTLQENVSDTTTHVVSLEPRRTLNLLRALARGLWILEYPWIVDSFRAGVWLSEEKYEMKDFSRAVEICRAERQAFGKDYRSELFTGLGLFYLPTRCGPLQKEDLSELIELCGGKITDQRRRAKFILGDANRQLEDRSYVTPFWILDSITQMQLQKLGRVNGFSNDNAAPASGANQQFSPVVPPKVQCVIHDTK